VRGWAGVGKMTAAYMADWTILTVYRPQQVYIDSGHRWFLWLSIRDFWCEVVADFIYPSVRDL